MHRRPHRGCQRSDVHSRQNLQYIYSYFSLVRNALQQHKLLTVTDNSIVWLFLRAFVCMMFARSLDGLGNCSCQKHCSVTAATNTAESAADLAFVTAAEALETGAEANATVHEMRGYVLAPPTKTSLRKWRKRGCCHEDEVQRVMISTWYTNSMSDCLYW